MHAVAQEQQSSGVEKTSADFCVWRLFFSFLLCRIAFDEEVATQKQNTERKKKKKNNKSGTRNHNGLWEESIIQIGFLYKSLAPSAREERQRNQL